MSASVKLSSALVNEARREAPVFSRSLAGQVEHWARLGKAVESAPGFTLDRVRAALAGEFSPSDLDEDEQEIFFDLLGQRQAADGAQAFAAQLLQESGNVGYDAAGNMVQTLGDGRVEILERAG